MTGGHRRRRRGPRLYLRGHLGCLGCSLPLAVFLAAAAAVVLALTGCTAGSAPVPSPSLPAPAPAATTYVSLNVSRSCQAGGFSVSISRATAADVPAIRRAVAQLLNGKAARRLARLAQCEVTP